MKKKETTGQEFQSFIETAVNTSEKEVVYSSILVSRLFLREEKTREEAREVLLFTEFYKDKPNNEIEQELDYIYNSSIELLKKEFEKGITLHCEKGFTH